MSGKPAAAADAGLQYTPIDDIPKIVSDLRAAFLTGKTRSVEYRKNQLKQLAFMLKDHKDDFVESLQKDLGRSRFESIFAELMGTTNEIVEAVAKLDKWAKPSKPWAGAAWAMHGAKIRSEPKGTVLVLGAWNYPITVQIGPVVGAIAAGNTVILKPSEVAGHTAKLIAELWNKYLDPECYRVVNGGIPETTAVLDQRFEHIFYTGNGTVGRIIAEKAAKWLCPTTLELGGKSPVYVDKSADLSIAAHRILWGKAFNCGQTCIAPDYVLIAPELQDKFVQELRKAYERFFPEGKGGVEQSASYARIINPGHWKRLSAMLSGTQGKIVLGGEGDENSKFLPPTVVANVKPDDALMTGEIFGPLLPIVPIHGVKEAVDFINSRDQPLSLYLFAGDQKVKDFFFDNTRSGACVQGDTLLHFAVDALPFGGTGPSGYGNYHGKASFDQFSHQRASLDAPSTGLLGKLIELVMSSRYPPYTEANLKKMSALAAYSISFKRPSNPHKSVTYSSSHSAGSAYIYSKRRLTKMASQDKKVGQHYGDVRHTFNLDALNAYLTSSVPAIAAPVTVKQFSFGQSNPTYILFDRNNVRYVLRKKPPGSLLSSTAHAVEREYRILKALGEYTKSLPEGSKDRIPVPEVYCLCEDKQVVGTPFYIMQFVDGRIFEDYRFLQLSDKEERKKCWLSAIDTLAALHRVDPAKVGLGDYGKREGFYTRQMKSLGKVSAIQAKVEEKDTPGKTVGPLPGGEQFLQWFSSNMPRDENTIVHGDYKIDNLIFHPTEPRVIGILDWELSTLGHPLSDLANLLQPYSTPCSDAKTINDPALWERSRKEGSLLLALGGLSEEQCPVPLENTLIKQYCEKTSRPYPIENWTAAKAWAWFRLAVIAQGIAARNAQGQASSAEARVYGSKFPLCAKNCFVVIEGDKPLASKL